MRYISIRINFHQPKSNKQDGIHVTKLVCHGWNMIWKSDHNTWTSMIVWSEFWNFDWQHSVIQITDVHFIQNSIILYKGRHPQLIASFPHEGIICSSQFSTCKPPPHTQTLNYLKHITNCTFKNLFGVTDLVLPVNSCEQKLGELHVLFSEVFVVEIHHATFFLTRDGDSNVGRMGEMETGGR